MMEDTRSPGSAHTQNEDSVEIIETLCIDFRDRLLVVLSTACQSEFTEAKKIVEERLRDILDTTSTLNSNVTYQGLDMGRSMCSPTNQEKHVSTVNLNVEFDQPMLDCSESTSPVTGRSLPTDYLDIAGTNQMTVGDPAYVDWYAPEPQETGHITVSCIPDSSFEGISMSSPALIDWYQQNANLTSTQENENNQVSDLNSFEGEPNYDDWLSNMTWSSSESQPSPSDGHLTGDTLPLNHINLDQNDQAAGSVTSISTSSLTPRSPQSVNSGFSRQTQASSPLSIFESCNGSQEPPSVTRSQRTSKKQASKRIAATSPRDQQVRPRVNRPTHQATERCASRMDQTEESSRRCIPSPRTSRRIDTEANSALDLHVEYALGRFSNTEEVFEIFKERLSEDRKHLSSLLTRLFYAVGSPDALRQLRDALDLARKTCTIPVYHNANDLATTVSMLDQLDATTTLSHILRRYHLVRLLDHRSKLESNHKAAKLAAKGTKRRLKYDCAMIEIMKRGAEAELEANARSVKDSQLKYRSKTQALTDLMRTLYPDLQPDGESTRTADGSEYNRKLTKLRNRLSCARNWYQFEQEFPGAILALIPCAAGDLSISIDHVEKLPSDVLRIFLDYLKEKRGTFLNKLSQALSKDLYDVLTRRKITKKFNLEKIDETRYERRSPTHD